MVRWHVTGKPGLGLVILNQISLFNSLWSRDDY